MTPLYPGDRLDQFELEALIASSGMASIFRARNLDTGALAAIKVPHPEAECDPIFHDRFRREIEIGSRLDHACIRRIFPLPPSRRVYMAMEWLEGRLLRQALTEEGALPVERAISIAIAILDALGYMHGQGVVHRDLKPENIMLLSPSAGEDRIKIIDFGIACLAGARRLTFGKLSQVMGSPDYISPEQVKNKRGDARSDVYAAGVIVYEMLTGETPFHGENPFAVMNARLRATPRAPSDINPGIPPQLDAIALRALERDPGRRYASAQEFAHHLIHWREAPAARHPGLVDLRQQPSPRTRSLASYFMLALIPAVVVALLLYVARAG